MRGGPRAGGLRGRCRVSEAPHAGFTVRSAGPDDGPAMLEIQHSSAVHHATIDPDRWQAPTLEAAARSRRRWHGIGPRDEGIVAVAADGTVVGMIELWLKRPRDPDSARIPPGSRRTSGSPSRRAGADEAWVAR